MKITDVKATMLQYKYENGIADAQNFFSTRNVVLVELFTDEGVTGLGESACFGGPPASTKYIVENELGPIVVGEDPLKIERVWQKMFDRTHQHGRGAIINASMSGIDIALWDILGKVAGLPVYKLLGGYTDRVQPYASSGFYSRGKSAEETAKEVEGYFRQGFRYAKIKVGRNPEVLLTPLANMGYAQECNHSLDEDLERVRLCCEVARRYGGRIMVDVNNTWNSFTALEMCRKFQEMGVFWVEEPLRLDDLDGSATLAAALDMAVAGYESECGGFYRFKEMIDRRAVDIVQCDAIWSGGFTECRRIANYALGHCMPVIPHVFSSAVSLIANTHLLASLPNGGLLEFDRNVYPLRDELITRPVTIADDGYVYLPQEPGLGIELDPEVVAKYAL